MVFFQVHVDFASSGIQHRPDFVQNDGGASISRGDRKHNREMSDLNDILIGNLLFVNNFFKFIYCT